MTSRRYAETGMHHMSAVNEEDKENTNPVNVVNNETPRAKYVPSKKPRISDSPLKTIQQHSLSKITETSSIFGNSRTSILESEMQVYSESNCKCEKFGKVMIEYKELQHKIETYMKSKNINSSQKDLTYSFFGASQVSFLEKEMQVYADDACKCKRFQAIIKEYNEILENIKSNDSLNGTLTTDPNFKEENNKLKVELEKAKMEMEKYKKASESATKENHWLQIGFKEERKRFEDKMVNLKKQFEDMKLGDKIEKKSDAKIDQLNDELLKMKSESEKHKALLQKAHNVIETLQTALNNEQRLTNQRMNELEKKKNAEIDDLKSKSNATIESLNQKLKESEELLQQLKTDKKLVEDEKNYFQNLFNLDESENAKMEKTSEATVTVIQKQIAELNEKLLKAEKENEIAKESAESAQNEVKILKTAKENVDYRNAELQKQTTKNDEALKTAINNVKELEEQLQALKEKLKDSEKEVSETQKNFETLAAENIMLQNENSKFKRFSSTKNTEIAKLKEAVLKEKHARQQEIFHLSDQLNKATEKLEEYKNATMNSMDSNSVQKEIFTLMQKIESLEQNEIGLKKNCENFKAEIQILQANNVELKNQIAVTNDGNVLLITVAEKEKSESEKRILELNNELSAVKIDLTKTNLIQSENFDLKEKLQICELNEAEAKAAYDRLKAEMDVLENEKTELQYATAAKNDELSKILEQKEKLESEHSLLLENLKEASEELEKVKTTLTHGKEKYLKLKELLKQKDEEIEAVATADGESDKQNREEIDSLKKKVNHYKKKNSESEEICTYLRADIEVLQTKKTALEKLCTTKDAEMAEMKDTVEKEKAYFQQQMSELNDLFLKSQIDAEGYKAVAENIQHEIAILQATLENERNSVNARIAEIQKQKSDEIEAFKASFGDTVSLKEEIAALKDKLEVFEKKLAEAEKTIAKANNDIGFLKSEKQYLERNLEMKKAEIAELQLNATFAESGGGIDKNQFEAIQTENKKLKQKLNKIYSDIKEADEAKNESENLLLELKTKLDNINTSPILPRPAFNIPEDLSNLLSSSFNPPPAEEQQQLLPYSENVSNILKEIQQECRAKNLKVSKNMNRKKSDSSKKDYSSEDSCTTQ